MQESWQVCMSVCFNPSRRRPVNKANLLQKAFNVAHRITWDSSSSSPANVRKIRHKFEKITGAFCDTQPAAGDQSAVARGIPGQEDAALHGQGGLLNTLQLLTVNSEHHGFPGAEVHGLVDQEKTTYTDVR